MINPLVSVIIPTFNRERFLEATLVSVRCQNYQNWECIIVDDGSTDNSKEIISKFTATDSRFKYYPRPEHVRKGANPCRNFGYSVSSGELVNWFDSDDIMTPDFVECKVDALLSNAALDGIISKRAFFKEDPNKIYARESRTLITDDLVEDFLLLRVTWYLQDVMWKRSFLDGKELFDEKLLAGQDRDFFIRMLLCTPKLDVVDKYVTLYRFHPDNITSQFNSLKNSQLKISHLYSVQKLIGLLADNDVMSDTIRMHYFKAVMKYLPFVIRQPEHYRTLKSVLRSLSANLSDYKVLWLKFYTAVLSFRLFGKGEKFLR